MTAPKSPTPATSELRAPGGLTRSEYSRVHHTVRKLWGRPTHCEKCSVVTGKRLEWSNVSGKYKLEREDWQMLCTPCHAVYDKRKAFCLRGHPQAGENIRKHTKGDQIRCRACNRLHSNRWNALNKEKKRLMNAKRTRRLTPEEEKVLYAPKNKINHILGSKEISNE